MGKVINRKADSNHELKPSHRIRQREGRQTIISMGHGILRSLFVHRVQNEALHQIGRIVLGMAGGYVHIQEDNPPPDLVYKGKTLLVNTLHTLTLDNVCDWIKTDNFVTFVGGLMMQAVSQSDDEWGEDLDACASELVEYYRDTAPQLVAEMKAGAVGSPAPSTQLH